MRVGKGEEAKRGRENRGFEGMNPWSEGSGEGWRVGRGHTAAVPCAVGNASVCTGGMEGAEGAVEERGGNQSERAWVRERCHRPIHRKHAGVEAYGLDEENGEDYEEEDYEEEEEEELYEG